MAAKTRADKMPNLANATPGFLVDELGEWRKKKKEAEKMEGFYKEAIKARLEPDQIYVEGENYELDITFQDRTDIDRDKLKEDYGEKWYAEHCKTTPMAVFRTKRRN